MKTRTTKKEKREYTTEDLKLDVEYLAGNSNLSEREAEVFILNLLVISRDTKTKNINKILSDRLDNLKEVKQ